MIEQAHCRRLHSFRSEKLSKTKTFANILIDSEFAQKANFRICPLYRVNLSWAKKYFCVRYVPTKVNVEVEHYIRSMRSTNVQCHQSLIWYSFAAEKPVMEINLGRENYWSEIMAPRRFTYELIYNNTCNQTAIKHSSNNPKPPLGHLFFLDNLKEYKSHVESNVKSVVPVQEKPHNIDQKQSGTEQMDKKLGPSLAQKDISLSRKESTLISCQTYGWCMTYTRGSALWSMLNRENGIGAKSYRQRIGGWPCQPLSRNSNCFLSSILSKLLQKI